jgi:hypothetical protein
MLYREYVKVGLALVLAALFTAVFAYQASAFSAGPGTPFSYTGKVVNVDNANNTITVQSGPDSEMAFDLNKDGTVMICNMTGSLTDLKIGDMVTVSYFEERDHYVANLIDLVQSGMKRC